MDLLQRTKKAEDRLLDTVQRGQDAVIDVVAKASARLPELPELPFADRLPEPTRVIERVYSPAERLLANQHKFAARVVKATRGPARKVAA